MCKGKSEDNNKLRRTKPGLKRLFLTLSLLFSFILGTPFLLKSIEIYRSQLPYDDIQSLSKTINSTQYLFPYHFNAIFVGFSHPTPHLHSAIRQHIRTLSPNNFTLTLHSPSQCLYDMRICQGIGTLDFHHKQDEELDRMLHPLLGHVRGYSVVVVNEGDREPGFTATVGKYRYAWILGHGQAEDIASMVAEIFVKVFVNGGREDNEIQNEFMPVGADGKLVLSFNLLNANPNDWIHDWDFQTVDDILLAPIVGALGAVANISVESQVLYHTPKASFSYWDDTSNSYIFSTKDLPFFMNSNEWHLDTSIAADGRSKILQLVVYVPSENECPLILQLPDGKISTTNGFISPMWGGVIVWNPPSCLSNLKTEHHRRHIISNQELEQIFEVFVGQLRQLFGLKSDNLYVDTDVLIKLLPSERGFSEWELDFLSRHHTYFNLVSCSTTLSSLSRLVQSLPRMIIMDKIGKQVKSSLMAAKLALTNASLGMYDASAVSSRHSRSLAEDAFFHPSIMSVSYYSFEHCFAVYSPFFLPVSLHVLLATVRECKRYKQEKSKYCLWNKI